MSGLVKEVFLPFEQRKLVALLAVLALCLPLFPLLDHWVRAHPLDEVITLAPRGSISKEIRVVVPENYELNLVFEQVDLPLEQVKTLIQLVGTSVYKDRERIPSGVRVPVRWALQEMI